MEESWEGHPPDSVFSLGGWTTNEIGEVPDKTGFKWVLKSRFAFV